MHPFLLKVFARCVAFCCGSLISLSAVVAAPNVILVLTDDLGYGDLGVLFQNGKASSKKLLTPQLDTMAGQGTILSRHYTSAPVCAPARATLLSGLHQGHERIRNSQHDKELADNHTLATVLKQAGYYTAAVGKWGVQGNGSDPLSWPAYPTKRGFDYFLGYVRTADGHQHYPAHTWPLGFNSRSRDPKQLFENNTDISADLDLCYTTDLFTAKAKEIIVKRTQQHPDQPFFIYLAYDTPHAALQLPTVAYPSGGGVSGGIQWTGNPGAVINTATGAIDQYYHPAYATQPWTDEEKRFATMVTRIDDCIGDLLQTLRDLGIEDDTIVVFTSDNGPHSEHYLSGGSYNASAFESYGELEGEKRDCFEGGIRVPTLVWGPGNVLAGQDDPTPSQFHDWLATLADYAGVTPPAQTDGVSLKPLLSGAGVQREGLVYVEFTVGGSTPGYFPNHGGTSRNQAQVIYRDGYKGIRNNISSHATPFSIYDTLNDPDESEDLTALPSTDPRHASFQALAEEMRLAVLRVRQPDSGAPRPYDGAEVAPLASLVVEPGIIAQRYEGDWPWVPDFEMLTEIDRLPASQIDAALLSRSTHAGLSFTGLLDIPTGGLWTFYLESDSGAVLHIHESLVIDDDYGHDGSERSGTMRLAAGHHPFRLDYRSGVASPQLVLRWAGPGTPKQEVPATALFREGTPDPAPTAVDDAATTLAGEPIRIAVLDNDFDDGMPQPLAIESVTQPALGLVTIDGDELVFTPPTGNFSVHRFSYTITDGTDQDTASVTVTLTAPAVAGLPVAHYTFDGPTGLEDSAGIRPGSLATNASIQGTVVRTGTAALRVDGSGGDEASDYGFRTTGVDFNLGTGARTIAFFMQADAVQPGGDQGTIFGFGPGGGAAGTRFDLRDQTLGADVLRIEVDGNGPGGGDRGGVTTDLSSGWNHVAVVMAAGGRLGDVELYLDGMSLGAVGAGSNPVVNTLPSPLVIGDSLLEGTSADAREWSGYIDDFRVYDTALSAAAVAELAAGVASPPGPPALANDVAAYVSDPSFGLAGDQTGFAQDPDGDGIPNALEAWFGTDPGTAEGGLEWVDVDPATGTLVHPRNESPISDLEVRYQWSPDLVQWYLGDGSQGPPGGPTVSMDPTPVAGATTVELTFPETEPRLFFRIEAIQTP